MVSKTAAELSTQGLAIGVFEVYLPLLRKAQMPHIKFRTVIRREREEKNTSSRVNHRVHR